MSAQLAQHVTENLEAHHACAQRLATALQEERGALLANDIAALQRVTAAKAAASEQLEVLGITLERLRSNAGADSIDALMARSDASGRFRARWTDVIALARDCAAANRDNAALLDARSGQLRAALRMIGGATGADQTYGREGGTAPGFAPRTFGSA